MAIWTNHQFSGTMSDYVKLWCDGIVEMYQSSRITWVFIIKFRYINCLQHIVMMIPDVEFTRYPKTSWPRDPAQPYQIHWDPLLGPFCCGKSSFFNREKWGENVTRRTHDTQLGQIWSVPPDPEGSKSPICVFFKSPSDLFFGVLQKDSGKKHAWIFRGGNVVSFSFFSTKDMLWVCYLFSGLSS